MTLLAPYRSAKRDPWPQWSYQLSRWHLASRLLRKVLMHTLGVWLNGQRQCPPLH